MRLRPKFFDPVWICVWTVIVFVGYAGSVLLLFAQAVSDQQRIADAIALIQATTPINSAGTSNKATILSNLNTYRSQVAPDPPPPPPDPACADGLDNDGDGLIDLADPGCADSTDTDEVNAPPPGAWVPPVGIPHPGAWFLSTSGAVQVVSSGGGDRTFSGTGTATAPVIYRGTGSPVFTGRVTITGSYVIVENLIVNGGIVRFTGHHLALRNSDVRNNKAAFSKTAISVNPNSADIVVFRNLIHDNGNWQSTTENDFHGVTASGPLQRFWILENELFHHQGDSIQVGHTGGNRVNGLYIGRNVLHHDRENAVDLKEVSNSVVSENAMFGYRATSSSEGAAVVLHYCPVQASIVNNLITDSQIGVSSASLNSSCSGVSVTNRIVGNVFWGILGKAVQGWGSGKVTQVVNNTFYGIGGAGVDISNVMTGSFVENNIFSNVGGADIAGSIVRRNNLPDGTNPQFVNAAAGNFRLQPSSPAITAGIASSVYPGFQSVFGVSIAVDRDGRARPAGSGWDLGAYEGP